MKNPHIIVDPKTNRCLCGMYAGESLSCNQIIASFAAIVNLAEKTNTLDHGLALSLEVVTDFIFPKVVDLP